MKFAHSIKQKTKVALLLFGIMGCIILVRILEDKSIKEMGKSFMSLYNDRLIPATDFFYMSEKLYAKKSLIESHFKQDQKINTNQDLLLSLKNSDKSIDSILARYEKTYLVTDEKDYLVGLKNNINASRIIELDMLNNNQNDGNYTLITTAYTRIFNDLGKLTQVQSKVGEQLIKNSQDTIAGNNIYSTIQFILAIIIGILIVSILFTSNVINIKNDKYNLN